MHAPVLLPKRRAPVISAQAANSARVEAAALARNELDCEVDATPGLDEELVGYALQTFPRVEAWGYACRGIEDHVRLVGPLLLRNNDSAPIDLADVLICRLLKYE